MGSISKLVLSICTLLTILLVALEIKGDESGILKDKVHMVITNNLTGNIPLGVHCKDKDHDIGYQSIKFGESYEFTFRPAFLIPNTLFFCGFKYTEFHYFVVYDQLRDDKVVKKDCHWEINQFGPCRHNVLVNPNSVECFPWPPPSPT